MHFPTSTGGDLVDSFQDWFADNVGEDFHPENVVAEEGKYVYLLADEHENGTAGEQGYGVRPTLEKIEIPEIFSVLFYEE